MNVVAQPWVVVLKKTNLHGYKILLIFFRTMKQRQNKCQKGENHAGNMQLKYFDGFSLKSEQEIPESGYDSKRF